MLIRVNRPLAIVCRFGVLARRSTFRRRRRRLIIFFLTFKALPVSFYFFYIYIQLSTLLETPASPVKSVPQTGKIDFRDRDAFPAARPPLPLSVIFPIFPFARFSPATDVPVCCDSELDTIITILIDFDRHSRRTTYVEKKNRITSSEYEYYTRHM